MLEIYTDGSCEPNPGWGGWAFVVAGDGYFQSGAEPEKTTCNRMEMLAIVKALEYVPAGGAARIYSDSQLAIKVLAGFWRGKANKDLIHAARRAGEGKTIKLRWVRGHVGNRWNERADELAEAARLTLGEPEYELGGGEPSLAVLMGERVA